MCGIAGVGGVSVKTRYPWIQNMTAALKHRGPDDEGYLALNTRKRKVLHLIGSDSQVEGHQLERFTQPANFFLGHRRLSILDTTIMGHQPMNSSDGNIWILYNGEIYNYIELREQLKQEGFTFRTGTDTEVLLAAYQKWGENCLRYLDGMWAFVIYDIRKNLLFGSRDRFGVKPLYYYKDSTYFAFASEIKSLLTLPFIKKILHQEAVFDFLVFSGLTFIEESFFKGILELQPAHAFRYDFATGELSKWKYYTLPCRQNWETFNKTKCNAYIRDTRELIIDAVRLRLRSDVPVGSALSGGIDSSSVVCVISRLMEERGDLFNLGARQKVFTAAFPGEDLDESQWAQMAAESAGAQWFKVFPKSDQFFVDIEDLAYTQEIPYTSPSVYAQYRVMKLARENGVKVLLDGQGADELFTGYTMYYDVFFYQLLRHLHLGAFFREIKHLKNAPLDKNELIPALLKQIRRSIVPYRFIRKYRMNRRGHLNNIKTEFWERYKERFDLIKARDFTSVNQMLYEYFTRQKLGNLLKYEDRNSMRFSIESRTPFADHLNLIEYMFDIPGVYKIHNGWSKYLLREAMTGILPGEIRQRTDKKGFVTPELKWIIELKEELPRYLTGALDEFIDMRPFLRDFNYTEAEAGVSSDQVDFTWRVVSLAVWKKVFNV